MASNLELAMRKKGIKPSQMADYFGVKINTIYYWRNNPKNLPVKKAQQIAEYLNMSFDELFLRP